MKAFWGRSLLIALCIATSSSCALLAPANVETRKEMLTKIPVDLPEGKTHQATLLVFPPETSTVYDTTQMAYEIKPYEIAYFSRTEWGEKPSEMNAMLFPSGEMRGWVLIAMPLSWVRHSVCPPAIGIR